MAEIIDFEDRISSDIDKASELVWDAGDTGDDDGRLSLIKEALKIDPDCTDAYNVLGYDEKDRGKRLEYFSKAVESFKNRYNQKFIDENTGAFWGILETRPYMRALLGYGKCLWDSGKTKEAIEIYNEMLTLNPSDNQGIRYKLVTWLFIIDDLNGVRKLLKKYKKDISACMMFSALLLKILENKERSLVQKYYDAAVKSNGYIVPYLLKKKRMPADIPDTYTFGSKEEAVIYIREEYGADAWAAHPEALKVLAGTAKERE
jgi:tetratricopeptide (TPR) repeat protein